MEMCFTPPIDQKRERGMKYTSIPLLEHIIEDVINCITDERWENVFHLFSHDNWVPRGFKNLRSFLLALKYHENLHEKVKALSKKLFLFIEHPMLALAHRWLKAIREAAALILLFWCLSTGIRYKRPKHVVCAAMPWTILPSLVILWGVCWMFYNASQTSPPALGFEFEDHFGQLGGPFELFHGLNLNFPDHDFGLFNNELDQLDPVVSGAPTGGSSGSEVPIHAEPGQIIPMPRQQQADMPSSQSDQPLALDDLPAVEEQAPSSEHARNPIRCAESGCRSELGTERELRRHRETVHDRSEFPCTVTGCKRGAQNPFNRLDNLQRHMRKAHSQGEQTPTTALRVTTTRGQKRRADTASPPVYSPESRRRRTEDAQDSMISTLNPPPASCHAQDEVARLREQLADARKREEIHVARIKALEKEAEAQAVKFEALRKDNEVQDAYIKLLGRKG